MLWASCKDYVIALPVRVIYLSAPDLEWCFGMGGFFFSWQITCIVNVSRVSVEKKVKITNVKNF